MASIVYSEDVFDEFDVSDEDISGCSSQETLLKWREELAITMADIIGQVEVSAMGGHAPEHWVYRASKATGYFRRAYARVENRLKALGWHDPYYRGEVPDLTRKLAEAKADDMTAMLKASGGRFVLASAGTWAEQAALLRDGKMDEFKKLCDELVGGIRK